MGNAAFLACRLTPSGCIVAGTKLAAHREALKSKKIKLSAKVDAAVQSVIAFLRDRLLSPYEDAAEEERRADQRARAASARKKSEAEPEPLG